MVTVTPKPVEKLVDGETPRLEELTKVEEKYKIHISVGKPLNASLGKQPVIQVMDEIVSLDRIRFTVDNFRQTKLDPASRSKRLVAFIDADFKLSYGLINDMQEELRKAVTQIRTSMKLNFNCIQKTTSYE